MFYNFSQMSNALKILTENIEKDNASIFILRQQVEQRMPIHQHEKGQLLLVFGGLAFLQTEKKDYYIPKHHYIWIPKRYPHRLNFNTSDLHIINIYFKDEDDLSHPFYGKAGIYPVSPLLTEILHFIRNYKGAYLPGSWEYEMLMTVKHLLPQEKLGSFFLQLPVSEDKALTEITRYMRANLHEPLQLPTVAHQFGFSTRTLTRMFTSRLNISFLQYLKMARIIRSVELLNSSDASISEVAYQVGYSSVAAFSNAFRQVMNVRPSDFKNK